MDIIEKSVGISRQIEFDFPNYTEESKLELIVKWAGGKDKELKFIIPNLPQSFENYYEPFVGGGSVYTAIQSNQAFINDKSEELTDLYKILKSSQRTDFFNALSEIIHNWKFLGNFCKKNAIFFTNLYKNYSEDKIEITELNNIIREFIFKNSEIFHEMFSTIFDFNIEYFINELNKNLIRKIKRMKVLEQQKGKLSNQDILYNIETAIKSAFYMYFRHLYNSVKKYKLSTYFSTAIFLFIRNYAYSGMFRYNSKGEFNVPYGGIGYNNKNFEKKINYLKSGALQKHLSNTTIENLDFEDFFVKHSPTENDFIFLDPPYDSEFSTYAKNEFTRQDQKRLANYLIHQIKGKWMMIIKNTDFIFALYSSKGLNIEIFDKTYLVSFMNRNDKKTEHLLIKNY